MSYNSVHNLAEIARKGGFMLNEGQSMTCESIDWRFIASLDTSRIVKDSDFEKLDECIPFLIKSSFGNLLSEVRILDPAIAKIYVISQLAIQYLLFCTKFLDKSVHSLRENIFNYQSKVVQTNELVRQHEQEIHELKRKIVEIENRKRFSCPKCDQKFSSSAALDIHTMKDHQQQDKESKEIKQDFNLINAIKLELEVKLLKEKLNVTEKELMEMSKKTCEKCRENSKRKFENVGVQSNFEEKEKDDTEKEAIQEILAAQMLQFEEWRAVEESRYRDEIEELKGKFEMTIQEMKANAKAQKPPEPAPRQKIVKSSNDDENLWKSRYTELEVMYQQQHRKMAETVKSIEESYQDKMRKIEDSMKKLEVVKVPAARHKIQRPKSPEVIVSVHEETTTTDDDSEIELINQALKPKIVEEIEPPPVEKLTFSGQKFKIQDAKKIQKEKSTNVSSRQIAEQLFYQRMKQMGIPVGQKNLTSPEKVQSSPVTPKRGSEKVQKKHKKFFISRKKIQEKVDSIFNSKQNKKKENSESQENLSNIPKQKLEEKESDEEQPEDPTLKPPQIDHDKPLKENVQKFPKTSTAKTEFRDDLERILYERLESQMVNSKSTKETTTAEKPIEMQPSTSHQTSAKSKKVLFDLDVRNEIQQQKIPKNAKSEVKKVKDKVNEVNDEDSDFDISSFTSYEK